MDTQELLANIEARKQEELAGFDETAYEATDAPSNVEMGVLSEDIYQRNIDARREAGRKQSPRGSSQMVLRIVQDAINGLDGREGLAHAYKRAKDDSDLLRERGDKARAEMVKQQYMEERFLPIVEVAVNFTSPDEVLNSEKALRTLDDYVLSTGSGRGYTASYVRTAYGEQLGKVPAHSDAYTTDAMRRIRRLAFVDNLRGAYGLAKKLKGEIDRGEHQISDADYLILRRVASAE